MCKFISLVATKTKVFGDGHLDSHEEIIKKSGLDDSKPKELLTFCRVEITPKDNNIFNHDLSNWVLKVDEERTPDWWSDKQEKMCLSKVKDILADKSIFLIGGEYEEINEDIRFVKDVKIKVLKGKLEKMYSGTVQEVLGGTVQEVCGGGTVQEVCGGTVQEVWGSANIIYFNEESYLRLEKKENGNNVLVKRWLKNVEVEIC